MTPSTTDTVEPRQFERRCFFYLHSIIRSISFFRGLRVSRFYVPTYKGV